MICQNAILSDEYMDYIWKADVNPPAEMDLLPYGVCAQYISPSFSVYYISRKEVFGNRTSLPIGDYALPWCYTQLNTESLETTKILQVQNQPALNLRGQGVILGFLDSGIELKQMGKPGYWSCGIRQIKVDVVPKDFNMEVSIHQKTLISCWRKNRKCFLEKMKTDMEPKWLQ